MATALGEGVQAPPYLSADSEPVVDAGAGVQPKKISLPDVVAPEFETATLPTADATWLGRLVRLKDAGAPEQILICITTSGGAYEWVVVALASS